MSVCQEFMYYLCLTWTVNAHSFKTKQWLKKYVLGCHLSAYRISYSPNQGGSQEQAYLLLWPMPGWLSSRVVSVLDSGAEGPRFKSQSRRWSGNSLSLTVHTHCASVHQAAKLVAALLRVAGVTAGLAESNGSLPPGLWLTLPAGRLPRTGISCGILCSVIEYGLPFLWPMLGQTDGRALYRFIDPALSQSTVVYKRSLSNTRFFGTTTTGMCSQAAARSAQPFLHNPQTMRHV